MRNAKDHVFVPGASVGSAVYLLLHKAKEGLLKHAVIPAQQQNMLMGRCTRTNHSQQTTDMRDADICVSGSQTHKEARKQRIPQ